jgi:hypothetical protein
MKDLSIPNKTFIGLLVFPNYPQSKVIAAAVLGIVLVKAEGLGGN